MDLLFSHYQESFSSTVIRVQTRVPPSPLPITPTPQQPRGLADQRSFKDAPCTRHDDIFCRVPNTTAGRRSLPQTYRDDGFSPLQIEEDLPIPDFDHLPSSLQEDDNTIQTNPLRSAIFQKILNSYPQLSRKLQRSHYVAKKFQDSYDNPPDCLYQAKPSDDVSVDNLASDFMGEEFDGGYHSFGENSSITSGGTFSPNSSTTENMHRTILEDTNVKNECTKFDELCFFESNLDSCSKFYDSIVAMPMTPVAKVITKPAKYQCPVCGKTYKGNTNLGYHMATHTGIRPHKCTVCGKAFTQKSTLRTHFRIHTGEKPYNCRTCARAFADYSTCMKHERTHTGEKPYACPVCGKCFAQSGNMLRHRQTHKDTPN